MRFEDELARLLKEAKKASRGYLSKRQEAYFKQRKKKPRRRRIGMLQRQLKPHEIRAMQETGLSLEQLGEASRAGEGDWRKAYDKYKDKMADIRKEILKANEARAKEERQAERKQTDAKQKQLWKLQSDLAKAKTEEERAQIQANIDQLQGKQAPQLREFTPKERAEVEKALLEGPAKVTELDKKLAELHEEEIAHNYMMYETKPTKEMVEQWGKPEEQWDILNSLNSAIRLYTQQKRGYEELIAREPELRAVERAETLKALGQTLEILEPQAKIAEAEAKIYRAETLSTDLDVKLVNLRKKMEEFAATSPEMRKKLAATGIQRDIGEALNDIERFKREAEEREAKPALTREEETGAAAVKAATIRKKVLEAEDPIIKRRRQDEILRQQALATFKEGLRGNRAAERDTEATIKKWWNEPTEADVEHEEALKSKRRALSDVNAGIRKAKVDGDDDEARRLELEREELEDGIVAHRKKKSPKEPLAKFRKRKLKELGAAAKAKPEADTIYQEIFDFLKGQNVLHVQINEFIADLKAGYAPAIEKAKEWGFYVAR